MRLRGVLGVVATVPLAMAALLAVIPQGSLACAAPFMRSVSPDGSHELTVCRRPHHGALPGQGSDGPGWAVLRDRAGYIGGAVSVRSLVEIGHPPEWEAGLARIPLVAEIALFPEDVPGFLRAIEDRVRRLRAHLGLVPSSEAFR